MLWIILCACHFFQVSVVLFQNFLFGVQGLKGGSTGHSESMKNQNADIVFLLQGTDISSFLFTEQSHTTHVRSSRDQHVKSSVAVVEQQMYNVSYLHFIIESM